MAVALPAALARLIDELDRSGLDWTLLRPRETLALPEGDVDLLAEPSALARVRELAEAQGFTRMPVPGADLHAALYDEREGRFVWLHVQGALRVAGGEVPARAVLAAAGRDGLRQPADAWLLWILLLRALVDKGELPERHRPHVQALARSGAGAPAELDSLARRHGLDTEAIGALAAAGDWEGLMAQGVHRPADPPSWRRRARAAVALVVRSRERRGLSAAVIGPDGAGKSTLVAALADSLPLPVLVQYMGLTGGRLPKADALRVPGVVFLARVAILWLRYARGLRHLAGGGIVLFERYTLDGAVPSGMRLSPAARASRALQRRVLPLPDLVLLLDAPGATLHARSGEYDAATLESWRVAFERLRASVPRLELLDAQRPAAEVQRDAERLIWRRYEELSASRKR